MTVAFKTGLGFADGAAVSSLVTASMTPAAGDLAVAFVTSFISAGTPAAPAVSGDFGVGAVWTKTFDFTYQTVGANDTRMTVWRCLLPGGSPSGAITADWAGVNETSCHLRPVSFSGHAVSGLNAADAFPHASVTATGTGTSNTVTIPALRDANSLAVGSMAHNFSEGVTNGSGFTSIGNSFAAAPSTSEEVQNNVTVVNFSWATSSAYGLIGFEIAGPVKSGFFRFL